MASNEDLNMKAKKAGTFLYILFVSNVLFTIYPGWDLASQYRGSGYDTTWGLSTNNFRHPKPPQTLPVLNRQY